MLNNGFIEEVKELYQLPGLTAKSPAMRSVGYRQIWEYLDGETTLDEAGRKALFATRQLAKRQITWLRSESDLKSFDPLEVGSVDAISGFLVDQLA
jgi:tRNA dimethylallyltransferase